MFLAPFQLITGDGWNTIVSFWDCLFSGAMLVSGSVIMVKIPSVNPGTCEMIHGGFMGPVGQPKNS